MIKPVRRGGVGVDVLGAGSGAGPGGGGGTAEGTLGGGRDDIAESYGLSSAG